MPEKTWELRGKAETSSLTDKGRRFFVVTKPFGEARQLYKTNLYSARTGQGEQRTIIPAHARKLRREMEQGTFTLTPVSVGVTPSQAKEVRYEEDGLAVLTVKEGDPLPLTDGGHRFAALELIRQAAGDSLQKARTEQEKAEAEKRLAVVDAQPITAVIHLDGDTQQDFVNLQAGRAVDAVVRASSAVEGGDAPGEGPGFGRLGDDSIMTGSGAAGNDLLEFRLTHNRGRPS
jgi:hypothetical protein